MSHPRTSSSSRLYLAAVAVIASTLLVGSTSTQAAEKTTINAGSGTVQWGPSTWSNGDPNNTATDQYNAVMSTAGSQLLLGGNTIGNRTVKSIFWNSGNSSLNIQGRTLTFDSGSSGGNARYGVYGTGGRIGITGAFSPKMILNSTLELVGANNSISGLWQAVPTAGPGGLIVSQTASDLFNRALSASTVFGHSGDTIIRNGQLTINNGSLAFRIGSSGVNNRVWDDGGTPLFANGTTAGSSVFFVNATGSLLIDLSAASPVGTWQLVDTSTVTFTFSPSASVRDINGTTLWTKNLDGTWSRIANGNTYTFYPATGTLIAPDQNNPPVAVGTAVTVAADASCQAETAAAGAGSYDLDEGDSITITVTPAIVTGIGPHTVTITVTDSYGETDTTTAVVTVEDRQSPELSGIPGAWTVGTSADGGVDCDVAYTALGLPTGTASDNCPDLGTITNDAADQTFSVGTPTVVTWTVTDGSSNTGQAQTVVTVVDDTKPVLTELDGTSIIMVQAECGESFTAPDVLATDNCDGQWTVAATGTVGSGLGEYIVTYTATDAAGNTATATRVVKVVDSTAPEISFVNGTTKDVSLGCDAIGNSFDPLANVTATDSCSSASLAVTASNLVSPLQAGTYTVTITATDASGNEATATRTITVAGYNVNGFMAPLNSSLVPLSQTAVAPSKALKATRNTIPLKMAISCGTDVIDNADVAALGLSAPSIVSIVDGMNNVIADEETVDAAGNSNLDNYFRYSDGQWIYNLDTNSGSGLVVGKTYVITIQMPDGSQKHAAFQLK